MKLPTRDTFRDTLNFFELPPPLERALHWVERHPRTVLAGALLLVLAVALTQAPAEPPAEPEAYTDEIPLFV